MKFLIYGSKGWIGSQFIDILQKKQLNYYEGKSRVDNINDVEKELDLVKPTHVISFIGRTQKN